MAGFNGAGLFFFTYNWVNDAANGVAITASRMDGQFNDAVSGFNLCLTRDGQGIATANLPMGGFKHTGAAAGASTGDYLVYGQSAGSLDNLSITTALNLTSGIAINWGGTHTQLTMTVGAGGTTFLDSDGSMAFRVGGATSFFTAAQINATGVFKFNNVMQLNSFAFNALPSATVGGKIFVTGTGQSGFGTQLDGVTSGSNNFPAFGDGTHWFIG